MVARDAGHGGPGRARNVAGRRHREVPRPLPTARHSVRSSLPAPNAYRTGAGRPGPRYWQQRADYRIEATLDPGRNEVRASETIHYVNNSPDALPYLWMFVEQNLCAPNSITNVLNQPPLRLPRQRLRLLLSGIQWRLDARLRPACRRPVGRRAAVASGMALTLKHTMYGTTMRVELPQPAGAGGRHRHRDRAGAFTCRRRAAAGWATTARCTRSPSGTRGWWYTTTSVAGITSHTSAPASSTWSTARSTSGSRCLPITSWPPPANCGTPIPC